MAKYSAQLVAKSSENKNVTTTLSNVNPDTAPVKIKQFAQTLNALTTNTYNETNYIVTTNLDTETPPVDTRQTPTLELQNPPTLAQVQSGVFPTVTYNGDGAIYIRRKSGCLNVALMVMNYENLSVGLSKYLNLEPTGGVYVVGAEGTQNFKPIEVEYTLA